MSPPPAGGVPAGRAALGTGDRFSFRARLFVRCHPDSVTEDGVAAARRVIYSGPVCCLLPNVATELANGRDCCAVFASCRYKASVLYRPHGAPDRIDYTITRA